MEATAIQGHAANKKNVPYALTCLQLCDKVKKSKVRNACCPLHEITLNDAFIFTCTCAGCLWKPLLENVNNVALKEEK